MVTFQQHSSGSRVYPYNNLVIESWEPSEHELIMYKNVLPALLQHKNTIYKNKTT